MQKNTEPENKKPAQRPNGQNSFEEFEGAAENGSLKSILVSGGP